MHTHTDYHGYLITTTKTNPNLVTPATFMSPLSHHVSITRNTTQLYTAMYSLLKSTTKGSQACFAVGVLAHYSNFTRVSLYVTSC